MGPSQTSWLMVAHWSPQKETPKFASAQHCLPGVQSSGPSHSSTRIVPEGHPEEAGWHAFDDALTQQTSCGSVQVELPQAIVVDDGTPASGATQEPYATPASGGTAWHTGHTAPVKLLKSAAG